jgi:AcrR family transcriptional regulator
MGVVPTKAKGKPSTRVGLTREQIITRALALMDDNGASWLTMRRLAEDLGVSAPTLYWHFRDRQELIDAAIDAALSAINDVPDLSGDWRQDVTTFMAHMRSDLTAHPCVTDLMRDRYPASAERMSRRALDIFDAMGMSPADTAGSARLMIWRVLGFATLENNIRTGTAYHEATGTNVYRVASTQAAPKTTDAQRALGTLDLDALFAYDVELFITGIAGLHQHG